MSEFHGGTLPRADRGGNSGGTLRDQENNATLLREIDNDRKSTLRDNRFGTATSFMSEHQSGTVFIRVSVQDLKLQKCLQFEIDETVWDAKQRILSIFAKDLKDPLNYGLYMPPMNGRAGKFLEEERQLREYPLHGPIGFVEFKYKRRVYKVIHLNPRKLKQLHNKTNFRQMIESVKAGNLNKINKLTNKGLDPNFHDSAGECPMSYAVGLPKDKCRDVIISLVSGGGHIDFRTRQGHTPMHKAVLEGNQTSVKTILDLGGSANYKDGKGLTPLYYSVLYGKNAACTEMLLHERATIGTRDEQGWYEVHQACKLGLVQHLEHLMFYGADLDVTNASGNTALHICAVNNNEQCARILLFRGANKHISNYNNQTAQQVAIIAGNVGLADLIKNFEERDVVLFREMPTFSSRRPRMSMYASTLSLISRSRSDPKLHMSAAIDDSNVTSPPSSMRSLPQQYQMYSDSGSYSASRGSDSPRSMSISSNSSGPVNSVADTGFWEGTVHDREGWFPAHHVQEVRLRNKAGSLGDLLAEESRENTLMYNRNTLATLVRSDNSDYGPRSVVLQRASEGYGFVLRGAKSQLKPSGELDFRPSAEFPALQYLDSVDPGSVSDRAGLRPGDFILEINGENVVRASHDRVVHLIRSTGDTLAMKVVTVRHGARGGQDWFVQQDKSLTMPSRQKKKAAPTPPTRDPRTSLSISKSEGQSISEEMAAMEKLDLAISRQDSEEKKTASIRSRTAAKRVSCVELDNIGVDKKLERAKSTPDLIDGNSKARKDIVYATPTVPDKKSNVYAVPNVNSASSGSVVPPSPNGTRPKGAPPPPPGENASKKQAPKPPTPDSYDSSGSSEVVKINTNNQSPHSSSKIIVKSTRKSESPYESSFRPGDSAKLTEEPKSAVKNGGHQRTGSTGSAPKDVSFADDKVIDHAASFLKKHPNAKLLITAKGQESLRNKTSMMFEPEPDYDSDSGEDKSRSPVRSKSAKQRQSVTVISVGDQKEKPASAPLNKRYTIHSSIPSEEKSSGFVIPPRPEGPAPSPPSQQLTIVQQKKTAAPSPPQHNTPVTTIKVKADITPEKTPPLPVSEPPELPKTPPPDFDDAPSPRYNPPSPKAIPAAPAPPPAPALPPVSGGPPAPPPPPPPPVPSTDDLSKVKSNVKADYIAHVPVPQDAIALAVAKRQERIEKDGVKIGPLKPKAETAAPMDSNQAAIIAAVAKRRQQLEQQQDTSVVDAIENRLQKTKKLQAAKFSIAGSKPGGVKKDNDTKPEIKTNGVKVASKPSVIVQSNIKNPVSQPVKADIKAEKEETTSKPTELSFKVKPVSTGISKNQSGITEIKPNFAPKQVKTFNNDTKQTNGLSNTKVKSQESLRLKPQPLEKSYATARNNDNKTVSEQTNNENNKNGQNGQSDFLALAEKRRQEYLSRKQKSTESKSSTASTPERKSEKVSPPVSAKPKTGPMKALPNMNGDAYSNVPPPPPGFRDGGNNNVVQLEIIPPPANFSSDSGVESSNQHSPAFSPDTASVVSSLSTLSSLSGEGRGNGFDDVIAPPPPGFDDPDATVIPPPPEFGNEKKGGKTYNDKLVDQWLCNDVLDWLDSLAMGQYKSSFQKHCVDGKKLLGLSRNNYIDLGVTQVGHRMTIERAIKKSEVKQKNLANNVIASEHL